MVMLLTSGWIEGSICIAEALDLGFSVAMSSGFHHYPLPINPTFLPAKETLWFQFAR